MSYRPQYRNSRGFIALDPKGLQFQINARVNDARRINDNSARVFLDLMDAGNVEAARKANRERVIMCVDNLCQNIEQHPAH